MNKLIIDCSYGMNVYVIKNDEEFLFNDYEQKKHTDNLLVKVNELLNKAKLTVNDIDAFCVCIGPGSFTGIRVAVSIIKGLAVNFKDKIFTASNFDILSFDKSNDSYFVIEGFSDYVYVRKILDKKIYDSCYSIEDFINECKLNNKLKIYAQNEKLQNILKKYEIISEIAVNNTILCFNEKIRNDDSTNINEINPLYLRASQAEIEREKKLGK